MSHLLIARQDSTTHFRVKVYAVLECEFIVQRHARVVEVIGDLVVLARASVAQPRRAANDRRRRRRQRSRAGHGYAVLFGRTCARSG